MLEGGRKWGMVTWALLAAVAALATETAAASETAAAPASETASKTALLTPLQGSDGLRDSLQTPVEDALGQALTRHGYAVLASQGGAGQRLVNCPTPECAEQALRRAGAVFAIVPAVWSRSGRPDELTLTLVPRSGRSLNASGPMEGDLAETGAMLVDALLEQRAALLGNSAVPGARAPSLRTGSSRRGDASASELRHPHAWKAGPVMLLAAGVGSFVAVGLAAGVKGENQQLNGAAVGAWSAIGAAAIAGGVAWWLVGERRRRTSATAPSPRAALGLHPTRIDLRLQF